MSRLITRRLKTRSSIPFPPSSFVGVLYFCLGCFSTCTIVTFKSTTFHHSPRRPLFGGCSSTCRRPHTPLRYVVRRRRGNAPWGRRQQRHRALASRPSLSAFRLLPTRLSLTPATTSRTSCCVWRVDAARHDARFRRGRRPLHMQAVRRERGVFPAGCTRLWLLGAHQSGAHSFGRP